MSDHQNKALSAARSLAKALALPSSRGSVYAWHDAAGDRIVVCADQRWLEESRTLPVSFGGFPVVYEDRLDASAHRRRFPARHILS